jgi:flagellar biosynthesis chaperone FliJ
MLIRICLIVAIVAGLAVGALNFIKVKEKIVALQTDLAQTKATLEATTQELNTTKENLETTTKELKTTQATLETTTAERDQAVAEAARRTQEAETLTEDLKRTTGERDEAQANLAAYRATGMSPEEITRANALIKDLQANLEGTRSENRVLGQKIANLQTQLDRFISPEKPVFLPANLRGKILVSDPKWNFVVIDVGENQGVLEHGEMLVNRNGKLVAKIVVRTVQKDRSVANVMPGWEIGEVLEGDQVIPAHPAS